MFPDYDSGMGDWRADKRRTGEIERNVDTLPLNEIEIDFVKFLFKIRNANYYKKTLAYSFFSGPSGNTQRERVFIAGKIFPVMNLFYSGEDANATRIEVRQFSTRELRLYVGEDRYPLYNINYISVDDDKIKLLLPKSYSGTNFETIILDFLTNGQATAHTVGGEFPDYETYKLALRDKAQTQKNWKGEDGCWLKDDRCNNVRSERWLNGYRYIVQHKIQGRLAPFKQVADFYMSVDGWLFRLGHRVKWCKGAMKLVAAIAESPVLFNFGGGEDGSMAIANDVETILSELNVGICDYAITQFHDLTYGKYATTPLTGDEAYLWDLRFISVEQGKVAPPIYSKTARSTIAKFQDMADKDPKGTHGIGAMIFNSVTPAFDDFEPNAKVDDDQFRIDLPLLMLYLDKHKPGWKGFKGKLEVDGTLKEEVKKIIRPYAI